MKRSILLACLAFAAAPAAACVPPPGLGFQQWYATCRRDMEDGYARGFAGAQSHDAFMQSMYRMYQSSRPTYNPVIEQQQHQLADTMARGQGDYMRSVEQQRARRTAAFVNQQDMKARQHADQMMYIQNEHCVVWNSNNTCRYKAPN